MQHGIEFLKRQVKDAVMQHQAFLRALEIHEEQAEDVRFRDLCSHHIPQVREHQRMLEEYQAQLGASKGAGRKSLGAAIGAAGELADAAREGAKLALDGDIVRAQQAEDQGKT